MEPASAPEHTPALEAVFQPVQAPTTFEETVERLGTAIRLGLLQPASRLPPERDLAERLRISRSTLRQALTTLVESGHLVSLRGRAGGTFVAERPPLGEDVAATVLGDAREVLDYRVAVETGAALLAAERASRSRPRAPRRAHGPDGRGHRVRGLPARRRPLSHRRGRGHRVAPDRGRHDRGAGSDERPDRAHRPPARGAAQLQRAAPAADRAPAPPGLRPRAVRVAREHTEGTEHILAGLLPK